MRTIDADLDLVDRFQVVADPCSTPVDVDRLVARFLIRLVRNSKQSRTSTGVSGGGVGFFSTSGDQERQTL